MNDRIKPRDRFPKLIIIRDKKNGNECDQHFLANNRDDLLNIALTVCDDYYNYNSDYLKNLAKEYIADLATYILKKSSPKLKNKKDHKELKEARDSYLLLKKVIKDLDGDLALSFISLGYVNIETKFFNEIKYE